MTATNWSASDNKAYKGKIDRAYVSTTEYWEIEYFVDRYLERRGHAKSTENRHALLGWIDAYPGKAPVKRDDLIAYLDKNVTTK